MAQSRRVSNRPYARGFALIMLLTWLPLLCTFSLFFSQTLNHILQQAKLRRHCLTEGYKIQKQLFLLRETPALFNRESRLRSRKLEEELKQMHPDIRRLSYPALAPQSGENRERRLVYELKQKSASGFRCGVLSLGEQIWNYRVIYEGNKGKF